MEMGYPHSALGVEVSRATQLVLGENLGLTYVSGTSAGVVGMAGEELGLFLFPCSLSFNKLA